LRLGNNPFNVPLQLAREGCDRGPQIVGAAHG
jgi:hypothetical protein